MPRRKRTAARALTPDETWELAWSFGSGPPGSSVFASAEEREAAYWAHREELLRNCGLLFRPIAFWRFEAPTLCRHARRHEIPSSVEGRQRWLADHDLLTPEEAALLRRWQEEDRHE